MMKSKFTFKKEGTIGTYISFYDSDSVCSLKIIQSGWRNKYHCILEWGEYEDVDYELYDKEQIQQRFLVEF